jgi:BASS family bile acid:Na+ symporter
MSIQSLIMLGITLSIFLTVLTIGMRVSPGDLQYVLSRPAQLARSLFAMNILAPVIAILICKTFSLHPAVIVALVTLSVSPVSAMFTKAMLPLIAIDNPAYARGLFFASTMLAVILTPLAVYVIQVMFGDGKVVLVGPLTVGKVVISSVLLPLVIGYLIGRWRPGTQQWIPVIQKVSGIVLLICVVPIIIGVWPLMTSIAREGTLTAIVLMALLGLAVGHWLGGPNDDDRTVLAFATVSRHPGVAIAVATLTDQPLAPIGVLLAVLVSELAAVPYKSWRKRLRALATASGHGPPPAGAH